MTQDMPKEIYVDERGNWFGDIEDDGPNSPRTKYTRYDIAERLALALEFLSTVDQWDDYRLKNDLELDMRCREARAALKQFREGV